MLIDAVISRLQEQGVSGTLLEEEWASVLSVGAEEEEFCASAAELGLDPFATDDSTRDAIIAVAHRLPAKIVHDFFTVARADSIESQANEVFGALNAAHENTSKIYTLWELRAQLLDTLERQDQSPWHQGYTSARLVRDILGISQEPLPTLAEIGKSLAGDTDEFRRAIIYHPATSDVYDALVGKNANDCPAFAVNRRSETATSRFQFARGLGDFLTAADQGPWLVTKALSDRQKRSRAFAAEFLAPADGIRSRLADEVVTGEGIDELACLFGVSSWVIVHQIENHEIAEIAGP